MFLDLIYTHGTTQNRSVKVGGPFMNNNRLKEKITLHANSFINLKAGGYKYDLTLRSTYLFIRHGYPSCSRCSYYKHHHKILYQSYIIYPTFISKCEGSVHIGPQNGHHHKFTRNICVWLYIILFLFVALSKKGLTCASVVIRFSLQSINHFFIAK